MSSSLSLDVAALIEQMIIWSGRSWSLVKKTIVWSYQIYGSIIPFSYMYSYAIVSYFVLQLLN